MPEYYKTIDITTGDEGVYGTKNALEADILTGENAGGVGGDVWNGIEHAGKMCV